MTAAAADILFLTPQFPLSLDWGGGIRTWHVLNRLRRYGKVCVLAMKSGHGPVPEGCEVHVEPVALGGVRSAATRVTSLLNGSSAALAQYRSGRFGARVAALAAAANVKWVAADHLVMAEYALSVPGASTIFFAHNAEQTIWRRRAEAASAAKRWLSEREYRKVSEIENDVCRRFDAVFFPTDGDVQAVFGAAAPHRRIATIENGVDAAFLCPVPVQEHGSEVLMPGSFFYDANRDAAEFFVRDVWPRVVGRVPGARLHIVGKGAARLTRTLGTVPAVRISSDVPDMKPYFDDARVMVVPLRIGGGSRLKIIESMARGTPVVSTTIGAEGLAVSPGVHLSIADDAVEFAEKVIALLQDREQWLQLTTAARLWAERRYTWDIVTAPVAGLFESQES
jgi:polysaccharide biosynthesis protein PslH